MGEILSKIRQAVPEKSRILKEKSILPHSNGIYHSNSHVHLRTYFMKRIMPKHCLNHEKNKFYSWLKTFSGNLLQNNNNNENI